jgi:hypothetical protein
MRYLRRSPAAGRRGDHHIEGDPPHAGSARNADPDYKYRHEGDRRKKDKDLISQAKRRAAEYRDNCDYEPPNEGAASLSSDILVSFAG